MSERYQYDDRVELKDGGEPVAIHLLDDSLVRLANAAYQAGREEALRGNDWLARWLGAAQDALANEQRKKGDRITFAASYLRQAQDALKAAANPNPKEGEKE